MKARWNQKAWDKFYNEVYMAEPDTDSFALGIVTTTDVFSISFKRHLEILVNLMLRKALPNDKEYSISMNIVEDTDFDGMKTARIVMYLKAHQKTGDSNE